MRYPYYPGCSVNGTAKAFEESLVAVLEAFEVGLDELDDWNCCGASAAHSIDEDRAIALSARTLALAEDRAPGSVPVELVTPCAGCYRALLTAQRSLEEQPAVARRIDGALRAVGLRYDRRVRVRHALDVLANEIGVERIAAAVTRPLDGLKVVCYYGCLLVRPDATFDDQHDPTSMDRLMGAIGAEPLDWPLKTRCCGGSCYGADPFSGTTPQGALSLSHALLREASRRGADAVVTACPLCQFNLEAFQGQMTREFGTPLDLTVGYVTQFLGLALGLSERQLGISRMLRWRLPEREPAMAGAVAEHAPAGQEGGDDA
jgi:heterodisulfide reductase subunit B2